MCPCSYSIESSLLQYIVIFHLFFSVSFPPFRCCGWSPSPTPSCGTQTWRPWLPWQRNTRYVRQGGSYHRGNQGDCKISSVIEYNSLISHFYAEIRLVPQQKIHSGYTTVHMHPGFWRKGATASPWIFCAPGSLGSHRG